MPTATVHFRVERVSHAAPAHPAFVESLRVALGGGRPTFDFFSGEMSALQELARKTAKEGDAAWIDIERASALGYDFLAGDLPAAYVRGGRGTLVVQFQPSLEVLSQDAAEFKTAGIATTYLVTAAGPVDVMVTWIEKLGPAIAGVALAPAIDAVFRATTRFVRGFISRAYTAAEAGADDAEAVADEAAEGAAEDAAIEDEVLADDLTVSVSFGPLAIAGLAVAAIVLVVAAILFFLSKAITCFVRVYNLTDRPFTLGICYRQDLEIRQQPTAGLLPPVGVPPAPPGVEAIDTVIYRANYLFLNSSELQGIGAVIQAPATHAFPGVTAMIDVPAVGDNSLFISLDGALRCSDVWNDAAGRYQDLHVADSRGTYRARMATNQSSGTSSSPVTGLDGYFYEFLIVVEQEGLFQRL